MLASHLKSHTKVHRFRCSACRFSSKFSNALKRHLLEKGHGRGYVLNPDGSIPEGGAVPFEPGSPTTRLRQKVAATAKTAATTTTTTSEAPRKPTTSSDVASDVGLVAGTDVKATLWTPPVATSHELHTADARKTSWRPAASGEELVLKRSPAAVCTPAATVAQAASVPPLPPLPALMSSTAATASLRAPSIYTCAVCGLDAGGYVELAQHMVTSHLSVTTSAPGRNAAAGATTPLKRRWPGDNDEPGAMSWIPLSRLSTPQLSHPARRSVFQPDDKREFWQPGFTPTSMPLFHQPSPPVGYRSMPSVSAAFGSLRAEQSSDGPSRIRADETSRTYERDPQRDRRVKSTKSYVVDSPRRTDAAPQNFADVSTSQLQWHRTKPPTDYVEHVSTPVSVTSGLPLDLSTKTSTLRCDQLPASVQSEVKRSRRKGKAFKVDADRLNSGSRDEDLVDSDPVGRYSSVTEMSSSWRISDDVNAASGERVRLSGRGPNFTGDRDIPLATLPRSGGSHRPDASDETAGQQTAATSRVGSGSSSTPLYQECRHCGLGFRDGELFAMHMDFHGRRDPFTCNFCGAATGNQVEFFLHVAHAPHNVRPVYVM